MEKGRNIFGKGKYFARMKKNGEGKGGKYLKKENISLWRRRKGRKIIGEGKYFLWSTRKRRKKLRTAF